MKEPSSWVATFTATTLSFIAIALLAVWLGYLAAITAVGLLVACLVYLILLLADKTHKLKLPSKGFFAPRNIIATTIILCLLFGFFQEHKKSRRHIESRMPSPVAPANHYDREQSKPIDKIYTPDIERPYTYQSTIQQKADLDISHDEMLYLLRAYSEAENKSLPKDVGNGVTLQNSHTDASGYIKYSYKLNNLTLADISFSTLRERMLPNLQQSVCSFIKDDPRLTKATFIFDYRGSNNVMFGSISVSPRDC